MTASSGVPHNADEPSTDEELEPDDAPYDDPAHFDDPLSVDPGYAIVEPPHVEAPPAEPRPGALPPPTRGRPPDKRGRNQQPLEERPGGPHRGLRVVWSTTKWVFGIAVLLALTCVAWGVIGFFIIRGGVNEANERVGPAPMAALSEPPGSALTSSRTILFLGVDTGGARSGAGRTDSIVLMRTDPDEHQISLLSIPRDLRVEVAGRGLNKINSAYAEGGTALLIRAVERLTAVPIHHVALIDFDSFPDVIDAVGGVTVDVPAPIVSNRFDCPYPSQVRCESWEGWRFEKGEQTMDGDRALIYSRVRENRLDESETDLERGGRQQKVIRATADQLISLRTFARLPFVGRDVTQPLATDLTTTELFELAWVMFRTPDESVIHCRLGGSASRIDGVSYVVGTPENAVVVNMFLGRAVPRKPTASGGAFAPGCPVSGSSSAGDAGS